MKYTADDALRMLEALPDDAPVDHDFKTDPPWFSHPEYRLPGGWTLNVYIDGYEWDYIDHIVTPDGAMLDPDMPECRVPSERVDAHGETIWHPVFFWSPKEGDRRWGLREDG